MSFALLDAVSAAGKVGRANEDGWGTKGRFAWIIDGATGLGDTPLLDAPSDAAWLTRTMDAALRAHADDAKTPAALLAAAAQHAQRRFEAERNRAPAERFEIPTAAVLLARWGADAIDVVELGDCGLLVRAGGTLSRVGGTAEGKALETQNAKRLKPGGGRGPDVVAFLRSIRNKANLPGGYTIFAPERSCVDGARQHTVPAPSPGEALLMTDGFEAAVEDYGLYDIEGLLDAAKTVGLSAPLDALRAVERDDPDCTRYPRFKQSDDASALYLSF